MLEVGAVLDQCPRLLRRLLGQGLGRLMVVGLVHVGWEGWASGWGYLWTVESREW